MTSKTWQDFFQPLYKDKLVRNLFVGGFVYAWIFGQGVPLWDDDFTSWFWKIKDSSIFRYVKEWISPLSTQPEYWGFNERPAQAFIYKLFYLVSGYEPWSYFLYKDLVFAAIGVLAFYWALRLLPQNQTARLSAAVAALFLLVSPGMMSSHIIHSDLATTAELWFLAATYLIWKETEKPTFDTKRWIAIAVFTYLGYKTKADLKLIPAILAAYVVCIPNLRAKWKQYSIPLGIMGLLGIPWGPGIFSKLPPFLPGSKGSQIGWMWQPASVDRLMEFFWSAQPYDFFTHLKDPGLSLGSVVGPFLIFPLLAFLVWKRVTHPTPHSPLNLMKLDLNPEQRATLFVLLWFAVMTVGVSSLSPINFTFRIRYGILLFIPFSILLSRLLYSPFQFFLGESKPRKLAFSLGLLFVPIALQLATNVARGIKYRKDLGQVMISVDQVYEYVNTRFPHLKLTLMPDFRSYDYRPNAGPAILNRHPLGSAQELNQKFSPNETLTISWSASLWQDLELIEHFSGCRTSTLFDQLVGCTPGTGTYLMRYIGPQPDYVKGEELRLKGNFVDAREQHERFLARYPGSLAGHFVVGLESMSLQDWVRADQAFAAIERHLPEHPSVTYNRALCLAALGKLDPAIDRLAKIAKAEPGNEGVQLNLAAYYIKQGKKKEAKTTLETFKSATQLNPGLEAKINSLLNQTQ